MRGDEQRPSGFIVLTSLDDRVPADHPLLAIRTIREHLTRWGHLVFLERSITARSWRGLSRLRFHSTVHGKHVHRAVRAIREAALSR
jgi:hypothetical protein